MKSTRTLLLLLIVLAVGVYGAQWMARHPQDWGQVLVRAGGYDISTTVPGAVLALALLGLVLWLLWSLLALPFRSWGRHRRKRARARLIEGLDLLHQGHWQRANKLLDAAAEDQEVGTIAHTAAARAAQARGDAEATRLHVQALEARSPVAHALLRADQAMAQAEPAQALDVLDVPAAQPLPPRGLLMRAQALAQTGRAAEAWGMLGALRQQRALPPEGLEALERELAALTLQQATDVNALAERWDVLPKACRADAQVVAAYVERAAALHWDDAAVHTLEQVLDARWDEGLAGLYGRLPVGKADSRRASAQRWLHSHPDSPALLVTLARLARQQGQWAQAQDFLHRALALGAGAEAWEELGLGHAAAGEDGMARRALANALAAQRGQATPELPGSRDLRQQIADQAVVEERNEHGLPRLRG